MCRSHAVDMRRALCRCAVRASQGTSQARSGFSRACAMAAQPSAPLARIAATAAAQRLAAQLSVRQRLHRGRTTPAAGAGLAAIQRTYVARQVARSARVLLAGPGAGGRTSSPGTHGLDAARKLVRPGTAPAVASGTAAKPGCFRSGCRQLACRGEMNSCARATAPPQWVAGWPASRDLALPFGWHRKQAPGHPAAAGHPDCPDRQTAGG